MRPAAGIPWPSSAPDHLRTPGLISNRPCYEGINLGPTLQVSSSAELFDAPETAIGFLVWLKEGFQEFEGESIAGGFTLKAFEELTSPQVGSDAFAGNIVVTPPGIPLDVVSYLVSWRVGNLVASVGSDELANGTLDPEDTGADIAARGRLDGFSSEFKEPTGINSVSASADLFETEEQARAYLDLQIQDLQVLVGTDIQEGVTLTNFQQTTPPQVGDAAVAGTITFSIPSAGLTLTQTLVSWHRGEVVGTVSAGTFGPEDRTAATDELAQRMDELILAALP